MNRPDVGQLHPLPASGELFNRWGIDLIGPLKRTREGYQYIIVATEYLAGWVAAAPLVDKSAASAAEFIMENIIYRFLAPKHILHDQGREFCNVLNVHLCEKLGVTQQIASAYHPQTSGLTGRFNQTLVSKLMGRVNPAQDDWNLYLGSILSGYRTGMQNSTRRSPFLLMYGVQPRMPVDIQTESVTEDTERKNCWSAEVPSEEVEARIMHCDEVIREVRDTGLANLKKAQDKQKKQYDLKHTGTFYKVGEQVLRKNMRRETRKGDKLIARWDGPFVIAEALGKGSCKLRNSSNEVMKQRYASTRLKRFHSDINNTSDEETDVGHAELPQKRIDLGADDYDISITMAAPGSDSFPFRPITTARHTHIKETFDFDNSMLLRLLFSLLLS